MPCCHHHCLYYSDGDTTIIGDINNITPLAVMSRWRGDGPIIIMIDTVLFTRSSLFVSLAPMSLHGTMKMGETNREE
jgi:hypothetical protein